MSKRKLSRSLAPATVDCGDLLLRLLSQASGGHGASIDDALIEALRAIATPCSFSTGETVFEQDSEPESVLLIGRGLLKLYRELPVGTRQITGFLGPGDILGGIKRSAGAHCTAQAITEVEGCALARKNFLQLVKEHSHLCFTLLIAATDEIEAQNEHITLLGRKRAPERLAAFLLFMDHRWDTGEGDTEGANGAAVSLPMSRSDIADYLGLTIETVSRTFASLRRKELIATPSIHSAVIRNLPALHDLAGFDELPVRRVSLGL